MAINLTELRSRWRIPAVLAVTVESGRVAVDHVRRENGGSRILRSLSLACGADRLLEDPARAGHELAQLFESEGVTERRCVVCLPAGWALSTTTDLPAVAAEDLRGFLELRAEREFPMAAAELALAHSAYTMPGGEPKATLAAVPLKRLDAVRRMLETAGCRVLSISLAVDPALADARDASGGSVNILLNGNHVDLIVTAGGGVVAMRTVGVAGGQGEGGLAPGHALGRELRITLGRLPETLRRNVGKARFIGTREKAEALLESSQPYLHRLGLQGIVPSARGVGTAQVGGTEVRPGVAVEAAGRHLQGQPVLFEFVAREISPVHVFLRRFDTRRHRWLVAIGLVVLVLPAVLVGARSHVEGRLQAEWKAMSGKVGELEILQAKVRQFRPWFGSSSPSLAILEGLVSAFPATGEVWAKSVEIQEGTRVTCSGFARNQGAWMEFYKGLQGRAGVGELQVQSVRGEDPVQFSFSYRWEDSHDN
jgi:hypothetical protein